VRCGKLIYIFTHSKHMPLHQITITITYMTCIVNGLVQVFYIESIEALWT